MSTLISSIVNKITGAPKLSANASAARTACATIEGATALAQQLGECAEASRFAGARRAAYKRQADEADHVARHLRLNDELGKRIPQAIEDGRAGARTALKNAERDIAAAEKAETAAQGKVDGHQALRAELTSTRTEALDAAAAALVAAQHELNAATQAGDLAGVEQGAITLYSAQQALQAAEGSQGPRMIQIHTLDSMIEKAVADRDAAGAAIEAARARRDGARSDFEAFETDRLMLEALMAVAKGAAASPTYNPRIIKEAVFVFNSAQAVPFWREATGTCLVGSSEMQRIVRALREPDWQVFDVDPASIDDPASEPVPEPEWIQAINADLRARDKEISSAVGSYPYRNESRVIVAGSAA